MAQPEQDEGVPVTGGALALLGHRGQVGLVLHGDPGLGQPFLQGRGQAAVPGGQAAGVTEIAGGRVDQAGRSDPEGVQPVGSRLLRGPLHRRHRLLDGGPGPGVPADRHGRLGEHPPDEVRDQHEDTFGADVERGQVGAVGDDAVQPGVRAPAQLAGLPHHGDQAGGGEPFDEVRDGRPGQSGQLFQLPCRQRALLLQQPQGEPVVDGPGGAR